MNGLSEREPYRRSIDIVVLFAVATVILAVGVTDVAGLRLASAEGKESGEEVVAERTPRNWKPIVEAVESTNMSDSQAVSSGGESSSSKSSSSKSPSSGSSQTEESPSEEAPVEEAPVEEAPVEEMPADTNTEVATPVEESPSTETPSNDNVSPGSYWGWPWTNTSG